MYRIDVPSASPTLPAPAAAGTAGYFTEGDPVAGEAATIFSADFANMLMMELINVVIAGGIAPSKTTYTQVRDAIFKMILGTSPQIGASGSIALAGGLLIVKWGRVTIPVTAAASVAQAANFADAYAGAAAFPTNCFGVVGIAEGAAQPVGWNPVSVTCPANLRTKTGFTTIVDTTDPGHNITQAVPVFYIALGN